MNRVARYHMECGEEMVAGKPLYEGQREYVRAEDYDELVAALEGLHAEYAKPPTDSVSQIVDRSLAWERARAILAKVKS